MIGHGVSSRSSHSAAAGRTVRSANPWTQSRMSRWSWVSSSENDGAPSPLLVVICSGDAASIDRSFRGGGLCIWLLPVSRPVITKAQPGRRSGMAAGQNPTDVAFVLGGGGVLGAHEVGMLRALAERSVIPDIVLGTSIGAVNGALFAADPSAEGVSRLTELWVDSNLAEVSTGGLLKRAGTLARTGTHVQSLREIRARLATALPVQRVEDLRLPFQCVAAAIERAAEHWFAAGDLADVV